MGVKQIACGAYHTMYLMEDSTVQAVGYNATGQLGIGNTFNYKVPVKLNLTNVKQIACGYDHTMFLMEDGTVKAVGKNDWGQLGIGNKINQNSPVNVSITSVKQIACGNDHTMFLMEDGTVKGVGRNESGQLGIGNSIDQTTAQIPSISSVKQITCGYQHTIFLKTNGTVFGTGSNVSGQLGLGDINSTVNPTIIPSTINIKQIACGLHHSLFLLTNGTVKVTGYNNYGQLGLGHTTSIKSPILLPFISGIIDISCGEYFSYLIKDKFYYSTGFNDYGQLGLGNVIYQLSYVEKSLVDSIKKADCGRNHVMFLINDGTVKAAGYNAFNQLGNSSGNNSLVFLNNIIYDIKISYNNAKLTLFDNNISIQYNLFNNILDAKILVYSNNNLIYTKTIPFIESEDIILISSDILKDNVSNITFRLITKNVNVILDNSFLIFKDENKLTLIDGYISTKEITNTKNYTDFIVETSHTGRLLLASWNQNKWELLERQKYNPVNSETNTTKLLFLIDKETKLKGYGIGWK